MSTRPSTGSAIPFTARGAVRVAACVLLIAASTAVIAQNALDNSLSTSGRRNYARPKPAVSKDTYTLNRATGSFSYNRANAFNDSTYSIYQRHTSDRFNAAHAAGVSTSANAYRRSGSSPNYAGSSATGTRRNSSFGTSLSTPHTTGSRGRPSSSSRRYAPSTTVAPAYHPSTYHGTSLDLPNASEPVTLSDRRGEWAPPITAERSSPVDHRGYSVADESIWPWR